MDGLRWLLLFFGLLVIGGVYAFSRRERSNRTATGKSDDRVEPVLNQDAGLSDGDDVDDEIGPAKSDSQDSSPLPELPSKIVALRLVARNKGTFAGDELLLNLRGTGMRHGKFGIFHHIDDVDRSVFSAASLVEPGSFDLENIKDQRIPGISLFMVLPGPMDGVEAFDMMMTAARTLAKSLNADLLDETGSSLSIQRQRYLREEIIQYQHSHLVA